MLIAISGGSRSKYHASFTAAQGARRNVQERNHQWLSLPGLSSSQFEGQFPSRCGHSLIPLPAGKVEVCSHPTMSAISVAEASTLPPQLFASGQSGTEEQAAKIRATTRTAMQNGRVSQATYETELQNLAA